MVGLVAAVLACQDSRLNAPYYPLVPPDSITWVSSSVIYDQSIDKRGHTIVFFMVDWCGWCRKLKSEVLTDSTVITMLTMHYNSVLINPDVDTPVPYLDSALSGGAFADAYHVTGYPHAIVFNRSGEVRHRISGYYPAAYYAYCLDSLRRIF